MLYYKSTKINKELQNENTNKQIKHKWNKILKIGGANKFFKI